MAAGGQPLVDTGAMAEIDRRQVACSGNAGRATGGTCSVLPWGREGGATPWSPRQRCLREARLTLGGARVRTLESVYGRS